MVDDSRYRTLLFLTDPTVGLDASLVTRDGDGLNPTWHVMYDGWNKPLIRLLYDKAIDGAFTIDTPETKPLWTFNHQTYAYTATVPINIWTLDTTRQTGEKMRNSMEQELRRIVETNFGGSFGVLRRFQKISPGSVDMGGWKLYGAKYILEYKYANPNYTPTVPTVDYGVIFAADSFTGGVEGAWGVSGAGATQAILHGDYLALTRNGADAASTSGTSLGTLVPVALYPKIRFRYKCSNANVIPAILVAGATGTQVIYPGNSTTWVTITATLVSATIGDYVLYVASGARTSNGIVYLDFIQNCQETHITPNCVKLPIPSALRDASLEPFGMVGQHTQAGGMDSLTVSMACDLDIEDSVVTWKRPQTGASATDKTPIEVFHQIQHEEATSVPWHWVNFGYGACKMRLKKCEADYFVDNLLNLEWEEVRLSSGGNTLETYRSRYSLDQVT
jgi:hypothetical protein